MTYSLAEREIVYSAGNELYEKGNYRESADLFMQLVLSEPFDELSWRGLAAAEQMGERYREAVHAWGMAALLADCDPLPHFHAAECLLSLRERGEALQALNCAEKRLSGDDAESLQLRSKIDLLRNTHD